MRSCLLLTWLALTVPAQASTINLYLTSGQSLSYGFGGCPALSTTQPYSNLMLATNPTGAFVALVESSSVTCGVTESPASGLGNALAYNKADSSYVVAVANEGVGSTSCAQNSKSGSFGYAASQTAYNTALSNATGAGNTLVVGGLMYTSGETDYSSNTSSGAQVKACMEQLYTDYHADMTVPRIFVNQLASWTAVTPKGNPCYTGDVSATCATYSTGAPGVPEGQLQVFLDHPTTFCFTGPKYQYTYNDSEHLSNTSYRALGELTGWFAYQTNVLGNQCLPLVPRQITISGVTITLQTWVPNGGSLAIDTSAVAQRTDYGFYFHDNAASAPSVGILRTCGGGSSPCISVSGDTITITLDGTPTGVTPRIAYAWKTPTNGSATTGASVAGSPGGNIRGGLVPSLSGSTQYFWLPTFDFPIPYSWNPPSNGSLAGNSSLGGNASR